MNYKRFNDYAGWAVWLVATIVYLLTIEPTASFWDCGEFIASAYKLEVGHPPGAPMFMLIARLFAMFVPAVYAATAVNVMSAMASSFTILLVASASLRFLFSGSSSPPIVSSQIPSQCKSSSFSSPSRKS